MSLEEQPQLLPASDADCGHDEAQREILNDINGRPAERLGQVCWWCHVCNAVFWGDRS